MDPVATTIGFIIAGVLVMLAAYFAWLQGATLRVVHFDTKLSAEHRLYLIRQCQRRFVGSLLLLILAALMVGSLFLDFSPEADANHEAARQSIRFLTIYVAVMIVVLLVILVVAIVDFSATARFSIRQQKQLLQEHQEMLAADLIAHRHRTSEPEA